MPRYDRSRCTIAAVLLFLPMLGCINARQQQEIELRRSFKNFVFSVDERNEEGLYLSVFFPGVDDYKKHVQDLLFDYLQAIQEGQPITFDDQGVVLSRFLGMTFHSYAIKEVKEVGKNDIHVRMAFRFAYDATIKQARYEDGTKVYVPAKPWGTAHQIEVGGDIPAPREQLKYVELDVVFRRTNHKGYWQVRTCKVDPDSIEWETSIATEF